MDLEKRREVKVSRANGREEDQEGRRVSEEEELGGKEEGEGLVGEREERRAEESEREVGRNPIIVNHKLAENDAVRSRTVEREERGEGRREL